MKENISLWQFFVLTITFELGSAVVVGIGNDAKQDAWIAILLAALPGFLLIWMYSYLLSLLPGKNLFEIMEVAFGRKFAMGLTIAYSVYFFYLACYVLRDFVEMIGSAVLFNTPSGVVAVTLMLVIAYILYLGFEVVGRVAEIFSPYMFFFIFLLSIFVWISGNFEIKNLQPVLSEGFQPIMNAIFPQLLGFPIGEIPIIFTVLMAHTSNFKYSRKVGMYAFGTGTVILVWAAILQIAVLGVDIKLRSDFPLLSVARMVSFANFFERIDATIVFIMMFGIILKISVFSFIGLKGLEYVFRMPYRPFVFPMSMLIALFSLINSESFAEHIEKGFKILPPYFHMPFQIYIPLLIFFIVIWKKKRHRFRKGGNR
ncbi:spore germination protein KB [Scopulibacillus darangshiensis]|uniref:Spore germination protein KB n=2 Tax=Scopulibacillus darangshiensis TaxID=442528 RepID=A0A4R2NMD6_9BACL|nr:spore germination protein KB [Scopulibacillus darangshiensis]